MVINAKGDARRIPDATRQKVLEVAREMGYVPNVSARNLRGASNRLLGVYTSNSIFPMTQQNFYYEFLLGIEEESQRARYDLVLFTSTGRSDTNHDEFGDDVSRLNLADGSILFGLDTNRAALVRLSQEDYRFVYIGRREVPGTSINYVAPHYRQIAAEVVERLVDSGHRNIVYVAERTGQEPHDDRYAGYGEAIGRHQLPNRSELDSDFDHIDAKWLDEVINRNVTAIAVESEEIANRLLRMTRRRGLDIPGDISVAILNDVTGGPRRGLSWSAIDIPRRQIGRQAVSMLVEMLGASRWPSPRIELVPCALTAGATIQDISLTA